MSSRQVLLIDDEQHLSRVIQLCLQKLAKWHITTAASGEEGLEKAASLIPDAILLDVMMPDMDGVTVLKQLRANLVTRPIPVILLTAKLYPPETNLQKQLGVAGVIAKPFDPLKLPIQIASLLNWETENSTN
jgi:CheY-like chemotaxis protein